MQAKRPPLRSWMRQAERPARAPTFSRKSPAAGAIKPGSPVRPFASNRGLSFAAGGKPFALTVEIEVACKIWAVVARFGDGGPAKAGEERQGASLAAKGAEFLPFDDAS